MTYEHGEYMDLETEHGDSYDSEYIVRGHVTPDEHAEAVRVFWDETYGEDPPETDPPRRRWARWSAMGTLTRNDGWRELSLYCEPGRGRFPVTVAEHAGEQDRRIARKRRVIDGEEAVKERWPDAYEIKVSSGTEDTGWHSRFRLPFLKHPVRWDAVGQHRVFVTLLDQEEFEARRYNKQNAPPSPAGADVCGGSSAESATST
jgi:hypothetical protein